VTSSGPGSGLAWAFAGSHDPCAVGCASVSAWSSAETLGGLGCPDLLEDLQRLPEPVFCLGGVAGGQGASAKARQRVTLIPGSPDLPGQVQRLLVARPGPAQVTDDPVQGPGLV
jgi:hypothetical protein